MNNEFTRFKLRDSEACFARPVWSGMQIPDKWRVVNIGQKTLRVGGYGFSSDQFVDSSDGTPLVKRATVNNKRASEQGTTEDFDDKYEVKNGDILVSMDGNFRSYFWQNGKAALNQRVCKISPQEGMNDRFLSYLLKPLLLQTEASTGATTVKSLSINEFDHMEPAVPPLSEQERIASVLHVVDQHVTKLDERYSELTKRKQALMQDLLTGQTRVTPDTPVLDSVETEYSDITENEWDIMNLPELFDKYQAGGTPNTSKDEYYVDDSKSDTDAYHFLKIDSITNNKYINRGSELITEEGLYNSTARLYRKGDLVLSIYGSYGKVGVLSTEAAVSQAMLGIVPNHRVANSEFLYYLLNSLDDRYDALASGTIQQNLSKSLISLIDVEVPPLWEQERIASILYTVDEMINRTETLREEHEQLKRGLMQDLLTGTVRTPKSLQVSPDAVQRSTVAE